MFALRPEVFSVAVTLRIPLTSTSKTTSRTASPAFIGGMGARVNSPREVLSSQLTRSPWNTGNCTVCWLSATVVKVLSNALVSAHGGSQNADENPKMVSRRVPSRSRLRRPFVGDASQACAFPDETAWSKKDCLKRPFMCTGCKRQAQVISTRSWSMVVAGNAILCGCCNVVEQKSTFEVPRTGPELLPTLQWQVHLPGPLGKERVRRGKEQGKRMKRSVPFFKTGDGLATRNHRSEDITLHGNAKR